MKIAFIFGLYSSQIHGKFPLSHLYSGVGLTGSESYYFNSIKGLSQLGHEVVAFCDCDQELPKMESLGGAVIYNLDRLSNIDHSFDVVVVFNEPNYLRFVPAQCLRICIQQLNDFNPHYCTPGYDDFVDAYSFASDKHRHHILSITNILHQKAFVMHNSINLEFFEGWETSERVPGSIAWCSSPDRGLHWVLNYFPLIKQVVPEATLKVFYRYQQWYEAARTLAEETGTRARYLNECFDRLGRNGENGVYLVDSIPNHQMAKELMRTKVLMYPCDTMRHTEGFSVTILDACAAGCVPIISDCDSIGDVYREAVEVLYGYPGKRKDDWVNTVVRGLKDEEFRQKIVKKARAFAELQAAPIRARDMERFFTQRLYYKRAGT